jgi:spore maturation protein CgeB
MSLLAADLPDERHKFFREYMLVLNTKDSDATLSRKIKYYLEHDKEREELTKKGYDLISKERNQEIYADRFVKTIQRVMVNT